MMRKLLLPLLTVAVLLTACVPSLQPLYTPETLVFREELIGIWKEKPDDEDSWTFSKADNNVYHLTIREKDASSQFDARLVRLGEHHFLDLYPKSDALEAAKLGDFYRATLVPGHLIIKVKLGAKLEMQLTQPNNLDKMLKADPKALAHTYIDSDRLLITATTADLQAFIKKHAESNELWADPGTMQKLVL
jgi:hypothetical protein